MKFKKLSVLFCSLLALTSAMAVSAAETETVSETEAASDKESTAYEADGGKRISHYDPACLRRNRHRKQTGTHRHRRLGKPRHASGTRHCSRGRFRRQLWYGNRKQPAPLDR